MHAEGILAVLAVVLGLGAVRYVQVRLFPWKTCPRCKGGRVYGAGGHRDCSRCGTSGRVRRWGAGKAE